MNIPINDAQKITQQLCDICFHILVRCGPFMKETIYQDLLIHELNKLHIVTTRELVFNYSFMDSDKKPVTICNNQFLRTDIEIPVYKCILEMKCATTATKDEQLWQLRNYLENREDRSWGILINFINKFGTKISPRVQCNLLYKTDEYYETSNAVENNKRRFHDIKPPIMRIRKYRTWSIESDAYPMKDEIVMEMSNE
tara:strand:- start:153 stop:746 length:594 start_codon:yes stop_codon:yes gene_type:complete